MTEVVARYVDSGSWGYVRVRLDDGRIMQEHRYVMEQHLGRQLESWEHVHHEDEDKHNNDLSNLKLKTKHTHPRDHQDPAAVMSLVCPTCGCDFERTERYVRSKKSLGQTRFYCGNSCSRRGNSTGVPHGTKSGYSHHGCRCDECRKANRENHLRYRKKKHKGK